VTIPLIAIDSISFTAYVTPEPQGSMKAFILKNKIDRNKDRAIVTSDNPDLKSFRQEVSKSALHKRHEAGFYEVMFIKHVPVVAEMKFYFAKPPSVSSKRTSHVVRPDIDKLQRSVFDSLKGIIYFDDSQVVDVHAKKEYGLPERVEITISGKVVETPQSLFVTQDDDF